MKTNRILIIDDDPNVGHLLKSIAKDVGYDAIATTGIREFGLVLLSWDPTHIVLDLHMPGFNGVEVLNLLGDMQCEARIVIISGVDAKIVAAARQVGLQLGLNIAGVLSKPLRSRLLHELLLRMKDDEPWLRAEALSYAIDRRDLILYFQPKAKIIKGQNGSVRMGVEVEGFEALARWEHPVHGIVAPSEFIPLAEETGLIDRLTVAILDKALRAILEWDEKGYSFSVSINVSAASLVDVTFADTMARKCEELGVPPSRIIIEITETAATQNEGEALKVLDELKAKGFTLSMDDFGVGYSSFSHLQQLPFSELKIDRIFLEGGLSKSREREVVKTIISLAHQLGMTVVAEGVESDTVARQLAEMGADYAQGHAISPPLAAKAVVPWLANRIASSRFDRIGYDGWDK